MDNHRFSSILLLLLLIHFVCSQTVIGQSPNESWQAREAINTNIDLAEHWRLQLFGRFESGLDYSYRRLRTGASFTYRMKRFLTVNQPGIDEEDEHNLVIGAAYEFLDRNAGDQISREHRVSLEAIPRYLLPAGFLASDRNRIEFRWVEGTYNARYRNRFFLSRPVILEEFRFAPYGTAEFFYDRNLHLWNRIQYGFGFQVPTKRRFMFDVYYLRQNCDKCSADPLNILGATLCIYLRSRK